jgi:hypothetical protein
MVRQFEREDHDWSSLRQFSGNSKVCVESYPQVYPQVLITCGQISPTYPQGRGDSSVLRKSSFNSQVVLRNLLIMLLASNLVMSGDK